MDSQCNAFRQVSISGQASHDAFQVSNEMLFKYLMRYFVVICHSRVHDALYILQRAGCDALAYCKAYWHLMSSAQCIVLSIVILFNMPDVMLLCKAYWLTRSTLRDAFTQVS